MTQRLLPQEGSLHLLQSMTAGKREGTVSSGLCDHCAYLLHCGVGLSQGGLCVAPGKGLKIIRSGPGTVLVTANIFIIHGENV